MPPKATKPSAGAAGPGEPLGIGYYLELLKGEAGKAGATTSKAASRLEAAVKVWSFSLTGEQQREEVFKAAVVPNLLAMLERGNPDERWAACGALLALAHSEKHITEVVSSRVIALAASLLASPHDRTKQPAAQLLSLLAQRIEYSARVADVALLSLLACCTPGAVSAWGGARITAMHAITALRALIENFQGDMNQVRAARRQMLANAGAIPTLLNLLCYAPRLPAQKTGPDGTVTAPGKSSGGSKHDKKKGKAKGTEGGPPAGRKDIIATHSAACLRYLALSPNFQQQLLESRQLPQLVQCLLTAGPEQAAFVCGILWEITADNDVARQVAEADGVRCCLNVLAKNLGGVKGKSKNKKSKDGKKSERNDVVQPPNYHEVAVCNASGVLHHVTFIDSAKVQVGALGGAALLMACLKVSNIQCFENATGTLWNAGLHPSNTAILEGAGAPAYLTHPVPTDWLVKVEPDPPVRRAAASFFITQSQS